MRFENKEQLDELIQKAKDKAIELETNDNAKKIGDKTPEAIKNYNTKRLVDFRIEYDSEVTVKTEQISAFERKITPEGDIISGDLYIFMIQQPKLNDAIRILYNNNEQGKLGDKLSLAWDCMIDKTNSSPDIFQDRIKLGYLPRMLNHIDALTGDQKKS